MRYLRFSDFYLTLILKEDNEIGDDFFFILPLLLPLRHHFVTDTLPYVAYQNWHDKMGAGKNGRNLFFYISDSQTFEKHKARHRRASHRALILPGTNWCGVGNVSSVEQTYGSNVGVDRCCHEHDRCDYTIEGFSTKYRLFNYRFHTLSHCECDDRYLVWYGQ